MMLANIFVIAVLIVYLVATIYGKISEESQVIQQIHNQNKNTKQASCIEAYQTGNLQTGCHCTLNHIQITVQDTIGKEPFGAVYSVITDETDLDREYAIKLMDNKGNFGKIEAQKNFMETLQVESVPNVAQIVPQLTCVEKDDVAWIIGMKKYDQDLTNFIQNNEIVTAFNQINILQFICQFGLQMSQALSKINENLLYVLKDIQPSSIMIENSDVDDIGHGIEKMQFRLIGFGKAQKISSKIGIEHDETDETDETAAIHIFEWMDDIKLKQASMLDDIDNSKQLQTRLATAIDMFSLYVTIWEVWKELEIKVSSSVIYSERKHSMQIAESTLLQLPKATKEYREMRNEYLKNILKEYQYKSEITGSIQKLKFQIMSKLFDVIYVDGKYNPLEMFSKITWQNQVQFWDNAVQSTNQLKQLYDNHQHADNSWKKLKNAMLSVDKMKKLKSKNQ